MAHEVSSPRWTEPDPRVIAEWIDEHARMDRALAPFGKRMLDQAGLIPGERVVDIGCGTGATTLDAWSHVAPTGGVTGIDVSQRMLAAARQRVHALKNTNVAFVQADAQTHRFEPGAFDCAISRFGVAHFAATALAFENIRHSLKSTGRFVFCEWTARADNEWMSLADHVARCVVPELFTHAGDAPEHANDFAVDSRLRTLLQEAGFLIVALDRHADELWIGSDPSDVLAWFCHLPEGRILDLLDSSSRQKLLDALSSELVQRTRIDGVYLAGTAWIVECRVPGNVNAEGR